MSKVRVWYQDAGAQSRVIVAGPGDLAGRIGTVWLDGPPGEPVATKWGISLGLFVSRGGSVRWL